MSMLLDSTLIEKKDPIFTVILNRPEVKNAVDGPTAEALANAFSEFENDDSFSVAVLCGAGNTFCVGADLKAGASTDETRMNRLETEQIAKYPQIYMRNDRMSVYEQWDKSFTDAMENEFLRGMKAINEGETLHGATMFTKGVGRHGKFE